MAAGGSGLREYIGGICARRGIPNYHDRFQEDWTPSGGLRLHLDVIEKGRARPTVVFMPGTNAYALLYGEFLAALADHGYNVVGFDPRGHGRSEGARGSYTVPELVSDLRAAVEYARGRFGDPVAVAGSSQGGIVCFYLAAAGDPVASAICHNLADLGDPRSVRLTRWPSLSRALKPWVLRAARVLPEWKVPLSLYLDLEAEPVKFLGSAANVAREDPLFVPYIRLRAMASLASEPLPCPVEEVRTPVMILHGERDTIFPLDYVEGIHARLTCRKSLQVHAGLPHYLVVDYLEEILPGILRWLRETCGP